MSEWTLQQPSPWWKRGRVHVAWRVLRGRPTMYRIRLRAPLIFDGAVPHVLVYECHITTGQLAVDPPVAELCIAPDPCGCRSCAPQRYPEFWDEMEGSG